MLNFTSNSAFGLDISDLSLKIVQLKKKKGGLFLASFVKQEIPRGLIKEGEIKKEAELVSVLKKALSKVKVSKRVVCNLPEEKVFIQIIQLPKMKESELDKAIYWEAEAHIPMSVNDAYLGWQIIEPIFKNIDHIDVLIAAAPKTLVGSYLSVLKKSGLEPVALEPESAAVVRSLSSQDDLAASVIVDLGAMGTNFVIFSALAIRFTSHVNISGQLFNQAIMKKLKVSEKEANQLKIKIGLSNEEGNKGVSQALEPIVNDLANQIKEYISFYHEHATHVHGPDGTISQVILCGGDSLLLNLPETLSSKLNLPVQMGNSLTNILLSDKKELVASEKKLTISKRESFTYTTAIGLALKDFF